MFSTDSVTSALDAFSRIAPYDSHDAGTEDKGLANLRSAMSHIENNGFSPMSKDESTAVCYFEIISYSAFQNFTVMLDAFKVCFDRGGVMNTNGLLALTSGLNWLSNFDRGFAGVFGTNFGIGGYGAATNGLVACARLASAIECGDLSGATISAAKLSAIVSLGNNPVIDLASDVAALTCHIYRSWYPTPPPPPPLLTTHLLLANAAAANPQKVSPQPEHPDRQV